MVSVAPWKARAGVVPRLRDSDGYRIRAAGVCIQGFGAEARVLLVSGGKNHEQWAIPGGGVEKDENHEEAAARELEEEAGVRAEVIERLGVFQDDDKQSRTTVFLMRATEELNQWQEHKFLEKKKARETQIAKAERRDKPLQGQFGRKRLWVPIHEGNAYLKNSHRQYLTAITGQTSK